MSPLPARSQHDCPGGCGRGVSNTMLACFTCWRRLPGHLKQLVNSTYLARLHTPADNARVSAHRMAVADATQWYRDNPINPTVHTAQPNRKEQP